MQRSTLRLICAILYWIAAIGNAVIFILTLKAINAAIAILWGICAVLNTKMYIDRY